MEAFNHAREMEARGCVLCSGCGIWFNPVALIAGRCRLCGIPGDNSVINASEASLAQPDAAAAPTSPVAAPTSPAGDIHMGGLDDANGCKF